MSFPRRGEIFWGPGKEKIRPLLVISNDQGNRYSSNVVVIPGTTKNIDTVYPVEVLVHGEGLPKLTKFQADSIFTIYRGHSKQPHFLKFFKNLLQCRVSVTPIHKISANETYPW